MCDSRTIVLKSATVLWNDDLSFQRQATQQALSSHTLIVFPCPPDALWIVTDDCITKRGLGVTLYVTCDNRLFLAGFFSAKLRKHQVTWLPCEVEALSITTAVNHFSPFIIHSQQ